MSEYPAIQYSFFVGAKDQVVIRADSVEDLVTKFNALTEPVGDREESAVSEVLNAINTIKSAGLVLSNPALDATSGSSSQSSNYSRSTQGAGGVTNGQPDKACPTCGDPATYREWNKKDGSGIWKAWKCTKDEKNHKITWAK